LFWTLETPAPLELIAPLFAAAGGSRAFFGCCSGTGRPDGSATRPRSFGDDPEGGVRSTASGGSGGRVRSLAGTGFLGDEEQDDGGGGGGGSESDE